MSRGFRESQYQTYCEHPLWEIYEYAGFEYEVEHPNGGLRLTPVPGQHPAAYKDRHIRNATQQYREDHK